LALAAYASSFGAGLVFDNKLVILNDARIQAVTSENVALILDEQYWHGNLTSDLYRPLTTFSYLFNYAVLGNGPDPAGYHWVNFALHAVNIALVYALALWILGELRIAVAVAAIWAVHPVLTESVTNVVGRADLLAALGVLTALVCHIRAEGATGRRRAWWLVALALATAVGIFSKESAIVAPAAMLTYDVAFARRSPWRARLANYAAAALPCLAFLFVRGLVLAKTPAALIPFTNNPLASADFRTGRLTALRVIGKYVGLLLWPGALSADYSYNQIPLFRPGDPAALAGVAICLGLAAAAVWAFFRQKQVFFFLALFFVTLAPTSNVFLPIGTIMAERFLYLPALGFAGSLAIGLRAASRRLPAWAAPALAGAICAAFAARTYARNLDWATEQTLMTSAAEAAPDSYKPHSSLAGILPDSAAIAEAERALAILDPLPDERNDARAYVDVGVCYRREGDRAAARDSRAAESWYRKSLDVLLRARSILKTYDRVNQQENLRRGKGKTSFGWWALYLELGRTYLRLSQPRDALEAFEQGRLRALRPELFEEIANAYRAMGDYRQATVVLTEGVWLDPGQTRLASELLELYRRTEPGSCAVRESASARSLDMDCPLVRERLCAGLRDLTRLAAKAGMPELAAQGEGVASRQMGCPAE
jgi:tetratricopeptide (TPR) repeat protein